MADDPTQGAEGAQGKTGKTGGPGEAGERGRTGDIGRVGDTGKTGDTGASGGHGREGRAGDQGEKGKTGPPGPPGDAGPKGPDSGQVTGEFQKAVIEETLKQVSGRAEQRADRKVVLKAAVAGFFAALLIMIPATWVVGFELASVNDLEKIAKQNCESATELADIFEEDEIAESAATRQFLAGSSALGLTSRQRDLLLRGAAERDAIKIARLQALADKDCPGDLQAKTDGKAKPTTKDP